MNFGELKTYAQEIVYEQTGVVVARAGQFVQRAQRHLENAHGFKEMEAEQTLTTVAGARTHASYAKAVALAYCKPRPDSRPFVLNGDGTKVQIEWLVSWGDRHKLYSNDPTETGRPCHIYERETDWEVFPYPDTLAPSGTVYADGNWRVLIPYYRRLAVLSNDSDTNWFSDNAEEALARYAAYYMLRLNRDDEEAFQTLAEAEREKQELIRLDKLRTISKQRLLRPVAGARGDAYRPKYRGRGIGLRRDI